VTYNYNLLFSTTIPQGEAGAPLGAADLVADPLFVNPTTGNFHLTAGSPAIGSGTGTLAPTTDFDGNPRPSPGGGFDRGAYQFQPSGTAAQRP
jgi:hypothetical protein